jgi:hypothetical protein
MSVPPSVLDREYLTVERWARAQGYSPSRSALLDLLVDLHADDLPPACDECSADAFRHYCDAHYWESVREAVRAETEA